ncbi:MAG: pyrimidine reductase family protein [Armatimonadota bacterium]|nr:pyrimidine reductase family protein [Armatimonadota bacterium]MDR7385857.1 pyrimidine reductase family protein [Armatimonadota bacterium]MDR7388617.1 pyrimidine reductase family protein [Armatimonadota bacterium]MDR7390782.1 pyrimidine reductase family protein [Armatimonadota bacterium]MDR7397198.1 pyrimidine reductase family protein [Armatimonadota bacterium]
MERVVRVLFPECREEALEDLYADLRFPEIAGRPFLYLNMVATADGAAHLGGRTRGMGGAADRVAFRRLREHCDVVLVGAGTVRLEGYGPPRLDPRAQERRRRRGSPPVPRLAVVSARLHLDPSLKLFAEPRNRPVVITTEDADPFRRRALEAVAEVVAFGRGSVDLPQALTWLYESGVRRVLCEGGPSLNAHLLAAKVVDELFLTVAPLLAGGAAGRIVAGPVGGPLRLALRELREYGGELLARYQVVR